MITSNNHRQHFGAMEQRPFQKRVNPKNHKSRGNKMGKIFLILVAIIGFGISANSQNLQKREYNDGKILAYIEYQKNYSTGSCNGCISSDEVLNIRWCCKKYAGLIDCNTISYTQINIYLTIRIITSFLRYMVDNQHINIL